MTKIIDHGDSCKSVRWKQADPPYLHFSLELRAEFASRQCQLCQLLMAEHSQEEFDRCMNNLIEANRRQRRPKE